MRIGIDIRSLLDRPLTGVGEYTERLLTQLIADPHGDTFVLFSNSYGARPQIPESWHHPHVTFCHTPLPNKLFNLSCALLQQPKIDRMMGHVDCVFAPNLQFLPLRSRVPLVVTIHDLSFLYYRESFSFKRRMWHAALRPATLAQRANTIIAVSLSTARNVERSFGVPSARIMVVPSGITPHVVSSDARRKTRDAFHLPEKFLLSLSTIEPRKNLITLLHAFSILKAEHHYTGDLVIAGVPGWSTNEFVRELARHPNRDAIHVLPAVREEQKHALYELAEIFCYPSVYEGFGFPPLEAASHGTPVVVGHHSSLHEMMGDAALLVDVYNPKDVAMAIYTLDHDLRIRQHYAAAGRAHATRYSWKAAADATRNIFHNLPHTNADRH